MPLKRNATDITHEKYIKDIRLQRFVERTLQISIECCFDVVHHIISDKGFREPDSYADAFTVLAEQGCVDTLPEKLLPNQDDCEKHLLTIA